MLYTCIPKNYISTKMTLDNYDGHINLKKHVQNVRSNLEMVIYYGYAICKILPTTFNE